jgi:hypothetical protein
MNGRQEYNPAVPGKDYSAIIKSSLFTGIFLSAASPIFSRGGCLKKSA